MSNSSTTATIQHYQQQQQWIIFKFDDRRMTGNHSNEQQQSASSTLADNAADDDVYLLLESLEPDLRPATPDQGNAKSQQLYLEHIKMAREYYEMHEQMAFYNKQRTELKRRKERQQRLRQLEEERRNYQIMRNMLIQDYKDGNIQQRANQTSERRSPQADLLMESGSAEGAEGGAYLDDDNWVIVPDERKD